MKKNYSKINLKSRFINFVKSLKKRLQILLFNARPLIIFELLFKFISTSIFIPLLWILLKVDMEVTNFAYITTDNVFQFLLNPLTIIIVIFLIILIGFVSMIDIGAAIFAFELSRQQKRTNLRDIVKFSCKNAFRVLKPKNLSLIIIVAILFPLLNISNTSIITQNLSLSSFFEESLESNAWIILISSIILIALIIILFRFVFIIQYFTLERLSFVEAAKKSNKLLRGNRIKSFFSILIIQIIIALINMLLSWLAVVLGNAAVDIFGSKSIIASVVISVILIAFFIVYTVMMGLFMPITCWKITTLYYENKTQAKETISNLPYKEPKISKIFKSRIYIIVICILSFILIMTTVLIYYVSNNRINLNIESQAITKTCASEDFTTDVPDYSLASITKAKESGADMIEQDLQITKDKKIVTYRKKYSVNGKSNTQSISDFTYQEIRNVFEDNPINGLRAGVTNLDKAKEYIEKLEKTGQTQASEELGIPLLEQMIQRAKEQDITMILNTDLIEEDLRSIETVFKIIKDSQSSSCIQICSKNYSVLQAAKQQDKNIKTIYLQGISIGDFESFTDADAFAVNNFNGSIEQVRNFHNANKLVYAWKINKKDKVKQAIENKSDVVVTYLVDESVKQSQNRGLPDFATKLLEISKN